LCEPDAWHMFQAFPSKRWRYHRGGDVDAVLATAREFSPRQKGFYLGVNPVAGPLDHCQRNEDPTCRRWLYLDCDPKRPADSNATEAEHRAALDAAGAIQGWLAGRGWPDPVCVDTGNGAALYYRVNPANDQRARELVVAVVQAVKAKF